MIFPLTAFRNRIVLLFLLVFILPVAVAHGAPGYPIELSPDGSYLVDQGNNPFFINGDTAWSLIVELSQASAETYLSDRAQKGFNLVLVNLIDNQFANWNTHAAYGFH